MTSCQQTFRTCIGLRGGVLSLRVKQNKKIVSGHILLMSGDMGALGAGVGWGIKPSDWSCAAPV